MTPGAGAYRLIVSQVVMQQLQECARQAAEQGLIQFYREAYWMSPRH